MSEECTRITLRTRRLPRRVACYECGGRIEVGEQYRELVAIRSEAFDRPFTRLVAHDSCVSSDPLWTLTTPAELNRRAAESMDYVRRAYGFQLGPGDRCTALGEPGTVRGADGGHVLVQLDSQRPKSRFRGRYHPRDITPEPA